MSAPRAPAARRPRALGGWVVCIRPAGGSRAVLYCTAEVPNRVTGPALQPHPHSCEARLRRGGALEVLGWEDGADEGPGPREELCDCT